MNDDVRKKSEIKGHLISNMHEIDQYLEVNLYKL